MREPNWPKRAAVFANSFSNQFELPVLFYVLTILAIITRQADLLFVLLAWVFVVLRVLQALVHVTSNDVRQRGALYGAGAIVLLDHVDRSSWSASCSAAFRDPAS